MKYHYGDKVRVVADPEYDGFYIGLEGTVMDYRKEDDMPYAIRIENEYRTFYARENELEKVPKT